MNNSLKRRSFSILNWQLHRSRANVSIFLSMMIRSSCHVVTGRSCFAFVQRRYKRDEQTSVVDATGEIMAIGFITAAFLLGAFPIVTSLQGQINRSFETLRIPILNVRKSKNNWSNLGNYFSFTVEKYPPSFSVIKGPDGKLMPVGYSADILIWISQRFNIK